MRTASPELTALINDSNEYRIADLVTITTVAGAVLRYTGADVPITFSGNTFTPFPFERGATRLTVGTQVDTLDLTLFGGVGDLIGGIPLPQFARNGGFDSATVTLRRAFLTAWDAAPTGALLMFTGNVSDALPARTSVKLTVKSDLELLNIRMPRNLYQAGCLHTVYDAGCGLSKASWAVNSSINSGSTATQFNCGLAQAAGYFDQGLIVFTSGANAGASRTVKQYTPGVILAALALQQAPSVGDTFTIYPGCDKTQATCTSKFSNVINFRGYPYVPIPETGV